LENLGNRAISATLDKIQQHQIALKSRVIVAGRAPIPSQYLCGTERPDSVNIVHEVLVQNIHGIMKRFKPLIASGATSIVISPSLLRQLELPHKSVFTSTQGLNGQVMMSAKERQKASHLFQYVEHVKPVDKSEVIAVPMKA
jgi:hypothetical protein